jgi:5-formyltetrahydrofolate cyclo-ligase
LISDIPVQPLDRKVAMRRAAYDARNAQENKDAVSEKAIQRLLALPQYRQAHTVLWYIDCRSELRTRQALPAALASAQRIIVPYCTVDEQGANKLGLWWLTSVDELIIGKWKILEPPQDRWGEPGKEIPPQQLDLAIVPGVGFSREGGRMGNGQGYYDRLLATVRPECRLIGLCYESQLFDDLVVSPHDVFMDQVVTEAAVYRGRGRSA